MTSPAASMTALRAMTAEGHFVIERSEVMGRQAFIAAAPCWTALTMFW